MDLKITGAFIAERRKLKKYTQVQLVMKLGVSEKTISKWECGKGFPDATLMLPLCKELEITANDLLSGKKLDDGEYEKRAEENLVKLVAEKKESHKKIILTITVMIITFLAAIPMIMFAGLLDIEPKTRILMIVIAFVVIVLGIIVACVLDNDYGSFECKHCGNKFTPTLMQYIWGMHTLTTRRLKCPKCGKKSFCKKRLTK